jgi:hypothetical protein
LTLDAAPGKGLCFSECFIDKVKNSGTILKKIVNGSIEWATLEQEVPGVRRKSLIGIDH